MKKCLLGIAFSAIVLSSCAGVEPMESSINTQSPKTIQKDLSAQEFNANASKGLLLDVRTPEEFSEGHILGAKNLNIYDANFSTELNKLDKNVIVYVYCRSGARSINASNMMKEKGFKEVYNLKGGYSSYPFK